MHQYQKVIKNTIDNWSFQSLKFDTFKLVLTQNKDRIFNFFCNLAGTRTMETQLKQ
jgi:hypothetical protein